MNSDVDVYYSEQTQPFSTRDIALKQYLSKASASILIRKTLENDIKLTIRDLHIRFKMYNLKLLFSREGNTPSDTTNIFIFRVPLISIHENNLIYNPD